MTDFDCKVDEDELIIELEDGQLAWRGHPSGYRVKKAIRHPSGGGCIVLLDWMEKPKKSFRNIVFVNAAGEIQWRSALPAGNADAYTDMKLSDGDLIAWSWSAYYVRLDPDTGRIISKEFTK